MDWIELAEGSVADCSECGDEHTDFTKGGEFHELLSDQQFSARYHFMKLVKQKLFEDMLSFCKTGVAAK